MTDKYKKFPDTRDVQQRMYIQPYIAPVVLPIELIDELFQYVDESDISKVHEYIIEKKIPLDSKNTDGDTLLHIIIRKKPSDVSEQSKIDIINRLFESKTVSNVPNKMGITPLHLAAKFQYVKILELLCKNNRNISPIDINGMTPMHYAIIGNIVTCKKTRAISHEKVDPRKLTVKPMIDKDLDEEIEVIPLKSTISELPMYDETYPSSSMEIQQCVNTSTETVKTLLKYGASINVQDKNRMTPIFYALRNMDYDMIKFLVDVFPSISVLPDNTFDTLIGDIPANYFIKQSVSLTSPINSNGLNPIQYFKSMYEIHLKIFSNDKNIITNINDFSQKHMEQLMKYLENDKTHEIHAMNELPIRTVVMITEFFSNLIKQSKSNSIKIFNATKPFDFENYPINKIYAEDTHVKNPPNIPILQDNINDIAEMYNTVLRNCEKTSRYNTLWKKYVTGLQQSTITLSNTYLNSLQTDVLRNTLLSMRNTVNVSELLRELDNVYSSTIVPTIVNYQYQPNKFSENKVFQNIADIISHILSTIVCYNMYREILYNVSEILTNYFISLSPADLEIVQERMRIYIYEYIEQIEKIQPGYKLRPMSHESNIIQLTMVVINILNRGNLGLRKIMLDNLSDSVVGLILNKTYDSTKMQWDPKLPMAKTLDELFSNQFNNALERILQPINVIKDTFASSILDDVTKNIIPYYTNVMKLSVTGMKSIIDSYCKYMDIESQYIKIYNLIFTHVN